MPEPFAWLSLDPDEEIVWSGSPRLHVVLWVAVPALVIPALLVIVWPGLAGVLAGLAAWVAVSLLAYAFVTNVEYVASTKYVYTKWGILGRSVTQIGLHNIQDTTLTQGIFGTYSDYGTVSFSTAGGEGATLAFYVVDEPSSVKATVDRQVGDARGVSDERTAASRSEGIDDLLAELRATRETAQRIDRSLERRGGRS